MYEIKNGKEKIKEYDNAGILIFDGEYLNGRKWNGKIYYKEEIYILKDGKGFIKEYKYRTSDSIIIFEGEYISNFFYSILHIRCFF